MSQSNTVFRTDRDPYVQRVDAPAPRPRAVAAPARRVTPGEAKVARHQLALHHHRLPAWVSDGAVVGIYEAACRRDSQGRDMLDDPKLLSHISELSEARADSTRADFGIGAGIDFGSSASEGSEPSTPDDPLWDRMVNAWKKPGRSSSRGRVGDDSMARGRGEFEAPMRRTPADETTHSTSAFERAGGGGNQGPEPDDGEFGRGVEDAQTAMFARQKDAHKTRDRRRDGGSVNGPQPRNAPRVPAGESVSPMRSAFGGGNQGSGEGSFSGDIGEDDWQNDDTRKAADACAARMKDAWQRKGAR